MKHVHIIGICGKGTSSLAILLQQKGYKITGSDSGIFEPTSTALQNNNIQYSVGYSSKNIPSNVDAFIVGSSTQLSIETNEEVRKAKEMGLPIFSFAEFLEKLTQDSFNIVITGSYGKSSCTSLATHILRESGKDPSYFIGAEPIDFLSAHSGTNPLFVLEGDEYPHDTISLTPKFVFYNPKTVLLTSAAHDHINKFPTIESYLETYKILLEKLSGGILVAAIEHPHVETLTKHYPNLVTYGLKTATYTPQNIQKGIISKFDICKDGIKLSTIETQLLGEHSIENIIGVSALLLENKIVSIEDIKKAVPTFRGVGKRLQLHNPNGLVPVYESFGSSLEKAKADIKAIQEYLPTKDIVLVFEPHTFGWRNRENLSWYETIFSNISTVIVYKPTEAGSTSHEQLSLNEIVDKISETNENVTAVKNPKTLLPTIEKSCGENSLILLMTSSNFDGTLEDVIDFFSKNPSNKF